MAKMDTSTEHCLLPSQQQTHEAVSPDSTRKTSAFSYDHNQNRISSHDSEISEDDGHSNILYNYLTGVTPTGIGTSVSVSEAYRALLAFSSPSLNERDKNTETSMIGSSNTNNNNNYSAHNNNNHSAHNNNNHSPHNNNTCNLTGHSTTQIGNHLSTCTICTIQNHNLRESYDRIQDSLKSFPVTVYGIKEIPSWNIYFVDQRNQLPDFSVPGNAILPDDDLNRCVSLTFSDISISKIAVDAVVNSTTECYAGTSGVDKIIHEEAGHFLRQACSSLTPLEIGEVEITPAFQLPANYIIHTNGPRRVGGGGEEYLKLERCYKKALDLMKSRSLRTVVFPCISTGRKQLNKEIAASVALKTVRHFLEHNKHHVDRVIFSLHNETDVVIYRRFMQIYFPKD